MPEGCRGVDHFLEIFDQIGGDAVNAGVALLQEWRRCRGGLGLRGGRHIPICGDGNGVSRRTKIRVDSGRQVLSGATCSV